MTINPSILMLLRGQMKRVRLQIEAGDECQADETGRLMCELADEAAALSRAITYAEIHCWDAALKQREDA